MHNQVKKAAPSYKKSNKETLRRNIALNDNSFSVAVDMAWLSVNQMSHSFMHRLRDQLAFFNTYAKLTFGVSAHHSKMLKDGWAKIRSIFCF